MAQFTVVAVHVIEIVVAPVVVGLANATGAMHDGLVEAALQRRVGGDIPQVPLAEETRAPTGGAQGVRQGTFVLAQQRATADGVPDAGAVGVAPGQQTGARGRTGGAHVIITQAQAFIMEGVEVWRAQDRVAGATQVAIALVIGHHEHDIGAPRIISVHAIPFRFASSGCGHDSAG